MRTGGKKDGQTDMTTLIGTLRHSANAPKKRQVEKKISKEYDTGSKKTEVRLLSLL